jgi:predicted GNAT family acetyltransferase
MTVTVSDAPERSRYEARIDGEVAGFAAYRHDGDVLVFTHTEVDDEHEGQGVGGALARHVLDDVRRRGLTARLRCPFLAEWARRHPEYSDVLTQPDG